MSRSPRLVCWLVTGAILAGSHPALARCETKPPPEGLVARCRSTNFTISDSMNESQRRAALDLTLTEWMEGCVVESRAAKLVAGAEDSVDKIFEQIKDRRGPLTVKIVPDYEPLTYEEGGKTCYGVESVSFRLGSALDQGSAPDLPGDPAAEKADQVKEAATAAENALKGRNVGNFAGVLHVLKDYYGDDFDDTYYNVRPTQMGFSQSLEVPPACFTELEGGKYTCVSESEALKRCERHLVPELLTHYKERGDRPAAYADALEEMAARIQEGIDYLHQVNHVQPDNPAVCTAVREGIIPKVESLAHGGMKSVYGAGKY